MDEHVGDDFPDEYSGDGPGYPGADAAPEGDDLPGDDLPGIGDAWADPEAPDNDSWGADAAPDAADAPDTADVPDTLDTIDLDAVDLDSDPGTGGPDTSDPDASDPDSGDPDSGDPGTGDAADEPDPVVPAADEPADDLADVPVVGDDAPVGLGADPDAPVADPGDGGWLDLPDLTDFDVPEPAGGPPWVDSGLLGDTGSVSDPGSVGDPVVDADGVPGTPEGGAEDLRAALGEPPAVGDPTDSAYQDLVASDDPAVRNLARLWGPPA